MRCRTSSIAVFWAVALIFGCNITSAQVTFEDLQEFVRDKHRQGSIRLRATVIDTYVFADRSRGLSVDIGGLDSQSSMNLPFDSIITAGLESAAECVSITQARSRPHQREFWDAPIAAIRDEVNTALQKEARLSDPNARSDVAFALRSRVKEILDNAIDTYVADNRMKRMHDFGPVAKGGGMGSDLSPLEFEVAMESADSQRVRVRPITPLQYPDSAVSFQPTMPREAPMQAPVHYGTTATFQIFGPIEAFFVPALAKDVYDYATIVKRRSNVPKPPWVRIVANGESLLSGMYYFRTVQSSDETKEKIMGPYIFRGNRSIRLQVYVNDIRQSIRNSEN
jgi:hypothetical protein